MIPAAKMSIVFCQGYSLTIAYVQQCALSQTKTANVICIDCKFQRGLGAFSKKSVLSKIFCASIQLDLKLLLHAYSYQKENATNIYSVLGIIDLLMQAATRDAIHQKQEKVETFYISILRK
uniref:Uncharacterized protein n=1 Tax=Glossina pallidipes TaxID=7398 RepID=A0A1A9ZD56_GLOPL